MRMNHDIVANVINLFADRNSVAAVMVGRILHRCLKPGLGRGKQGTWPTTPWNLERQQEDLRIMGYQLALMPISSQSSSSNGSRS